MACLQNASHWQSLKSECQCKRRTPNSNVWWKFMKVWDFHCNLWISEKFWIWKIAWKDFCERLGKVRTCWFIKFLNQNVLAIFFFLKDLLVLFIYLFLILNLKIIKNLVGFFEENFFIFFRYLFSCEDLGKFSINLSFFFFFGKFLNLKFVENLVVFSFKKTLWYFMKVLIILSKSRICENMLGILGMTFSCVLENGWKPM